MLHLPHFLELEALSKPFTLDACADNDGRNAQCPLYCCPNNSFLEFDCRHHHVWINPPFEHKLMRRIVRHYLQCKQAAPTTTSACILLPEWVITPLMPYLRHMLLLKTYPARTSVMTVPTIPPSNDRLVFSQGLPFALHVYYDRCYTPLPNPVSTSLAEQALLASCYIAGSRANANIGGGLDGNMAIDTLASRNFIDYQFVKTLQVKIKKHPAWLSDSIILGDNSERKSYGIVHVYVEIDSYHDMLWCDVINLPSDFQLILGHKWLNDHQCILNFSHKTCTFRQFGKRHEIFCGPIPTIYNSSSTSQHMSCQTTHLTALQMKRLFRKQKNIDQNKTFFVLVQPDDCARSIPNDPHLQSLIQSYNHVFQESPSGLPPQRDVQHAINIQPCSSPPFKPIYRLSLKERHEVTKTIEDLLNNGLIQPSTSPFGAPILFVGKKDGSLRMCVDYRALNKLTIKNRYPLPRIDDLLDQLYGASYFTTLDLASGYHQIRIVPRDIPKTAFRTYLGHFEWNVMPFGLCNAPTTFQNATNNLFGQRIGKFILVYMDDILIYSKSKTEHLQHIEEVLSLLASQKYYVKLSKCEFMKTELKFLGHTISANGLKVDPDKIEVIKNWTPPTDKTGVRSLLGFGNYFRRFIYRYSDIVLPLLNLTKSNTPTIWTSECQQAFEQLKHAIVNAPVLCHPDLSQPFEVICDASNYATGAILLQHGHPCAFASKKLLPAECNYTTEEKELLAVIHALKLFRCYLEGNTFTILTDHNPLKYFETKQDMSPRQARWAHYLSRFDYKWEWIKGKHNPADLLSRNPIFAPLLCVTTRSQTTNLSDSPSLIKPSKRTHKYSANHMPLNQCNTVRITTEPQDQTSLTPDIVRLGYQHDPWFSDTRHTQSLALKNGLWYKGKLLVLPKYFQLRKWAMEEAHEPPYCGHLGFNKTMQNLKRTCWWQGMTQHLKDFINSCHSCLRNKPYLQKPAGLLNPLPIPQRPWSSISMDLIVELPVTKDGYNAIITIVDRLTKMTHFIPCTTNVTALQLAHLFLHHIFKLHGVPQDIVSDRDPKFVSAFWREFCKLLGTKLNMSTAYHPETDGQTERMNRILEEMLRHYVAPHQEDWDHFLPTCEFAINNAVHDSTGYSPFYLTYGYDPLTPATLASPSSVPAAADLHKQLFDNLQLAKKHLEAAQQRQKQYADKKRRMVEYTVGDMVLLSTQHIGLYCKGTPKLLPRFIGPFQITKRVGELAYRLNLPPTMKMHNVFHVSRLRPFKDDGRVQPPPPPIVVDNELEYEVDKIYAHRDVKVGKNRTRREYLVRWKGYGVEHDEYVPEANLGNAKGMISEYWKTL